MNKLLIIGASSGIGLRATQIGLDRGFKIKAFARSAHNLSIDDDNLEKVSGNALSSHDIEAALDGCDAVIVALGVPMNLKLLTGPITLFSESIDVLIPLMLKHNVKRLLCVTGFGAGKSINAIHPFQKIGFNMVFGRAYSDKSLQENKIAQSVLDWTIVRPGVLTNRKQFTPYKILEKSSEWKNGIISRTNVADFMINEVSKNDFVHKAPVLIS